jgi:hypothetical protein
VQLDNAALFNIILTGNNNNIAASSGFDIDSSSTNTQLAQITLKILIVAL